MPETDAEGNAWIFCIIFYAFNGLAGCKWINHHEGDWELVTVCVEERKNRTPFALSTRGRQYGNMDDMIKARDKDGNDTNPPVVYVALGSHANYSKPDVIRSPEMYSAGRVQRFLFRVDGWIHYLFLFIYPEPESPPHCA